MRNCFHTAVVRKKPALLLTLICLFMCCTIHNMPVDEISMFSVGLVCIYTVLIHFVCEDVTQHLL